MAKVEYPTELTKKYWDKKKPLVIKGKKTGIGEALDELNTKYDDIKWANYEAQNTIASIDKKLKELPALCREGIEPLGKKAKEIKTLATEWSAKFKKEKLTPKAASDACDAIAEAAKKFISDVDDYQGAQALEYMEMRKQCVVKLRQVLKPVMAKTQIKIKGLLEDIKAYAQKPTKETYWSLFKGDPNARGYTTGCKNWDQYLAEFPEIREQCHKGDAMDDFFPCMEDYGANWAEPQFEEKVNKKKCPGMSEEDTYKFHAKQMILATPTIKKFQTALDKLMTILDG
jgi:uncharacterized protein with HEPN domain